MGIDKLVPAPAWRWPLVMLLALWAVALLGHRDTAQGMLELWNKSESYAHCWVVPPIALWLAWRLRHQVAALTPQAAPWFLLPMLGAEVLWLLGALVGVNAAAQFALVAVLVLSVPLVMGWPVARALAFPLGFVFFCVPVGDFLTPSLMQATADFTIMAVRLSGVPVYREGLYFSIPSGNWSVVEACSGIRYLMASVMVGSLFAYMNYQSTRKRLIFAGVSILVPIVANWLRAYMIVMLGHLSGNRLAVGADHLLYGWVFFGMVIMALYWIGARWADPEPAWQAPPVAAAGPLPTSLSFLASAALGSLVIVSAAMAQQGLESGTDAAPVQLVLPDELGQGAWRRQAIAPALEWQPVIKNPVAQERAGYLGPDGASLGLIVGYFKGQSGTSKVVSGLNRLVKVEDPHWNLLESGKTVVQQASQPFEVLDHRITEADLSGTQPRLKVRAWRFYWIDGHWLADDVQGKLRGVWGRLNGRADDAAYVLIYAEDRGPETGAQMTRFLADVVPALSASWAGRGAALPASH